MRKNEEVEALIRQEVLEESRERVPTLIYNIAFICGKVPHPLLYLIYTWWVIVYLFNFINNRTHENGGNKRGGGVALQICLFLSVISSLLVCTNRVSYEIGLFMLRRSYKEKLEKFQLANV